MRKFVLILPAVGAAALTVGATESSSLLVEGHSVGMGALCSIAAVVFSAAVWGGAKFQNIDDRLDSMSEKLNSLHCLSSRNGKRNCVARKKV